MCLSVTTDYPPPTPAVLYRCSQLSTEWEGLEDACKKRTAHLSKAITREQVSSTGGTVLMKGFTKCLFTDTHCSHPTGQQQENGCTVPAEIMESIS